MSDISQLINGLNSSDVSERAAAAEELSLLGTEARPAATSLVRAVGDDEEVTEWAVAALEEIGAPAGDDLPALQELLADENADVAYWAATLIGRLGPASSRSADALAAVLKSERDVAVRQRCAWALGEIGPAASSAADALALAAESSEARLARLAQASLASVRGG